MAPHPRATGRTGTGVQMVAGVAVDVVRARTWGASAKTRECELRGWARRTARIGTWERARVQVQHTAHVYRIWCMILSGQMEVIHTGRTHETCSVAPEEILHPARPPPTPPSETVQARNNVDPWHSQVRSDLLFECPRS